MNNDKRDDLIKKYKGKLNNKNLKKIKGCEDISDEEAEEQLRAMDVIITLAFKSFQRKIIKKGIE